MLIGEPVPADLQIQNNITLSAWVYLTSYPAAGSYYTVAGSENSSEDGIGLYIYGGGSTGSGRPAGSLDLDIGNGSSWYSAYTTSQIPLNQWVLVTAVASANQPDQFYLNGVLQPYLGQSGETIWNGTVAYNNTWFAIGQSVSSNWAFNGLMDEVQVYNTALTAAQIHGIYITGSAGMNPVTPAAVNGACGTANGQSFSTAPMDNLCSVGTASLVTGSGTSWSWACNGLYGGSNNSCSATETTASIPASDNVILSQVNWLFGYPNGGDLGGTVPAGSSFAVSSNGNIVYSTMWGNSIEMFNPNTDISTTLGTYTNAGGVTLDSSNNLYVGGQYSSTILKVPFVAGAYVSFPDPSGAGYTPPVNCTGGDTAACVVAPLSSISGIGTEALAFDSHGNLFLSTSNQGNNPPQPHAIYECTAACLLTGTPAPVLVFQEPTSATPVTSGQLYIGDLAIDPWGNLFFTDSNFINQFWNGSTFPNINSYSDLYELPATTAAGYGGVATGFAASPTVLYTYTPSALVHYNDLIDGVAVDANGTVYFATQNDGVFAFPNNGATPSKASVAASMYSVSNQGTNLLTLDGQGNAYVAANGTVLNPTGNAIGRVTINNLSAPTTTLGVPVTTSATLDPVTTILNDGNCATPETVGINSSTTEFSAVASTSCETILWTGSSSTGGSAFATTVTFTPSATGKRTATLTTTDSNGNSGTASVSGTD